MRLADIINGPWAITGDMHREIQDIYRSKRLDSADLKTTLEGLAITKRDPLAGAAIVAASAGRKTESRGTYTVVDNVAIIPVHDVISKRMNMFMEICGGTSTQILSRDFAAAQNDPSIKGVLLYGDTPGGTVDGTMEAADIITAYRGNKPTIAFTDGMIASAGIWLLAGADEIYISSDTNPIGSIGVVAAHVDVSKREEMWGRKITEITAGDYKRIASNYAPLTAEGRAQIQADLDYIYTAFVNHVAAMRGLDVADHESWANGRVFLGKQAMAAGLADGISTMDELINRLSSGQGRVTQKQQQRKAVATSPATLSQEEKDMDAKKLKEEYPGVVAEIEQAARAGMVEQAKVTEEKDRVVALAAAAFGEEAGAKFGAVVDKGLSADDLKTLGISFATTQAADSGVDKESREQILGALKDGGNQPVGKLNEKDKADATGGFADKVAAYARENKISQSEAIKACRKSDPKGYAAWIDDANANPAAESGDEE